MDTPRIAAVSYLNTVPLVWGMLHGPQRNRFRIDFCVPSECAQRLEAGEADLGIVPVMEMWRQGLEFLPGTGIACHGAVRSILLLSRVSPDRIRTVAADNGSRTSVMLTRVILKHRYGVEPRVWAQEPDPEAMLEAADAALLIGDAALRVDPPSTALHCLDLGAEWFALTGLPMVFALWAGRPGDVEQMARMCVGETLAGSLAYGRERIDEIVRVESRHRDFSEALVREYLTRYIVFDIGEQELAGMKRFLRYAEQIDGLLSSHSARVQPTSV